MKTVMQFLFDLCAAVTHITLTITTTPINDF